MLQPECAMLHRCAALQQARNAGSSHTLALCEGSLVLQT